MRPVGLVDAERLLAEALASGHAAEISRYSRLLDQLDPARRPAPSLGGAALWYVEQGLAVFPLMAGSKQPFPRSRGCKDATLDPDRVRQWWDVAPHANIGIATGYAVDVIDIDGPTGVESLLALTREHPHMLDEQLGVVLTPRAGGRHYYVPRHPDGDGNGAAFAPGIDYRGRGGYVVAPPSRTDVGSYRWLRPLDVPAVIAGRAVA